MLLAKLVSSERRHAGFDPSGAQSYEYQTWHGQSTVGHTDTKHKQTADSNYNTVYINNSTVLKRKKRLAEIGTQRIAEWKLSETVWHWELWWASVYQWHDVYGPKK